ncbi:MAG TPA: SRPBCC domain-containing protein [Bacteroidota bacterium]|nr:SRPBCC domain-containing protein [Bacteroidota bacterium]
MKVRILTFKTLLTIGSNIDHNLRRLNMPAIFHDFPIKASASSVFRAISSPQGLDAWWTKRSSGQPEKGIEYKLWFGPEYDWRAMVSTCTLNKEFEFQMTSADKDWKETRVGFVLDENAGIVRVRFCHAGWPESNEHYRVSCYCWAMYLRLLKRYVELGEVVPYESRLDV